MSAKVAKNGSNGAHTAGIYADMSVDGPVIGDLVVIIDKAKNLPNRKTIGKQDPYCAARLGKEANKTETDKRGGQTPRWDQELRFTVHDSADYYSLKVSVFNDDKKTDLIGETFVNLENVVVLGGGRFDGWHHLNYRGRFAGEIRLELTYYDIRPKVEKPIANRRDPARNDLQSSEREEVGGPRQLKQVKRRPLPADPTNSSSSNLSYVQTEPAQQPTLPQMHSEADFQRPSSYFSPESITPPPQQYNALPHPDSAAAPLPSHYQPTLNDSFVQRNDPFGYTYSDSGRDSDYGPPPNMGMRPQPGSGLTRAPYTIAGDDFQHAGDGAAPPPPPAHAGRISQMIPSHVSNSMPAMSHSYSAPPETLHQMIPDRRSYEQSQHDSMISEDFQSQSYEDDQYAQPIPRHHSQDSGYVAQSRSVEERPPPPPMHRSSGGSGPVTPDSRQQNYDQAGFPAPLNVSQRRMAQAQGLDTSHGAHRYSLSASGSPHGSYSQSQYQSGTPSSSRNSYPQPAPSQAGFSKADSPARDQYPNMPASLMAGYSRSNVSPSVERDIIEHEPQMVSQTAAGYPGSARPSPSHAQHVSMQPDTARFSSARLPDGPESGSQPRRSAVAVIKPRAISPDPRTPSRKSVSPQPPQMEFERRLSGVPFSPDAYDALNPNATSPGNSERGSRYQTPDQPRQPATHDLRESVSNERIIGHDGREIDPSDHLPSDTWAPEPEKKTPQKATRAEAARSSRASPQGAQPMPSMGRRVPREPAPRPHSISATPVYAHNSEPHTPASAGASASRNRLQKKLRMHTTTSGLGNTNSSPLASYDSSPAVATPASAPRSLPRNPQSDRVLRERENYLGGHSHGYASSPYGGSAGGSPGMAARGSPMGGAGFSGSPSSGPPIPAKVPLSKGREDYSALSEEMKNIEIGSVSRHPRAVRRSVY
ncbi:MAG: hypothetical protein M4579_002149 [Chaenotheca gracillima]|nr:MAG: hypothetical protein M4579_002149 [Chaenotheca gracillima]